MKNINKKIILSCCVISLFGLPAFSGIEYDAGMNAYKNGQYDFAKTLFEKAVKVNSKDVNAKYMLAQILVKQKQYSQAKNIYDEIIKIAPTSKAADLSRNGINLIDDYLKRSNTDNSQPEVSVKNNLPAPLSEPDYVKNAYKNGKLYLRKQGVTRIYIDPSAEEYKDLIYSAFDEWQEPLGSAVIFRYSGNPDDASVIISCQATKNEISDDKFGITTSKFNGDYITESKIVIYSVNKYGKSLPKNMIYHALLHEIGHAVGILGHSIDPNDIMSTGTDVYLPHLSQRDKNTASELYSRNKKNYDAETIQEAKVKEFKYIGKKIPNDAANFIDLGDEYMSSGKYNDAIEQYNMAERLVESEDLYYRFVNVYRKQGDKDNEIVYLKKILDINKSNINVLGDLIANYYSQRRFYDIYYAIDKFVKDNPDKANDPKILEYKKRFPASKVKQLESFKKYLK